MIACRMMEKLEISRFESYTTINDYDIINEGEWTKDTEDYAEYGSGESDIQEIGESGHEIWKALAINDQTGEIVELTAKVYLRVSYETDDCSGGVEVMRVEVIDRNDSTYYALVGRHTEYGLSNMEARVIAFDKFKVPNRGIMELLDKSAASISNARTSGNDKLPLEMRSVVYEGHEVEY